MSDQAAQATSQTEIDPIYYTCLQCGHLRDMHIQKTPGLLERILGMCQECSCGQYQAHPLPNPDPLANDPRAQATRKLLKERGAVNMKEVDEYIEAQRVAEEVIEKGSSTVSGIMTEGFGDQVEGSFYAQIRMPPPPCSSCGHRHNDHLSSSSPLEVRTNLGGCQFVDSHGHCNCRMYEPKQFDEEPTQPVNPSTKVRIRYMQTVEIHSHATLMEITETLLSLHPKAFITSMDFHKGAQGDQRDWDHVTLHIREEI